MPISKPIERLDTPFVFSLGPFLLRSEIDLQELRGTTGSGSHAVEIRLGGIPSSIAGAVGNDQCRLTSNEYLLDIAGTARYYVCNGNEVRVEVVAGAPIANVSTYLLGSIFGVLCHQNGMLPLHASAIDCDGAVTAFLGHSGAGKSTLAACLKRRGYRIVSDDICLLRPDSGAQRELFHVIPIAGWMKLWHNSLEHLGQEAVEENRVFSSDDKFRVYLNEAQHETESRRLRLRRVVFLTRSADAGAAPVLQPMPLLEAIAGLMEMTYAGYVPEASGNRGGLFQQCAMACRDVQALRLTVPWSLGRIEATLELLEGVLER